MRSAILTLCLALAACTQFPDLDGTVPPNLENADFPDFVPSAQLGAGGATRTDPEETTTALDARIAALRARAAALQRREIVGADDQTRLDTVRN
ncbi:hypothetical protein [uncultured Tateyamaria sp.]|uniref:hypothetical protein n=1 Tax=uncultured Tateyamaria sp. TaxID=455651 RepID=UPI00260C47CF|nr:hypothetical protein [uncultured Tateyamaria sp.]